MAEAIPERVVWAVEQLSPRPSDRILEIGCGGGHAVALICARITKGGVVAIDRSALQARRARDHNRACIADGRVRVLTASLTDASRDLDGERFDRILAVNVNAFWTAPAPALAAVRRLLKPRGRVYLVYEPPSEGQARRIAKTMATVLPERSFALDEVRETAFRRSRGVCFVAR